ncbi:response regulator transcription factor [Microbispora bryophytorum]|uniref:Response regulator transcription factor n=1 Tax=Microbispora bryophytorum subsp. camponoti TaxID=1677852 RepID=A0ABR8LBE6_9ACTN|nr:response regulator transcription factor [Microbispora camponoti]MBD3148207.1 response regulator transcription factor [Microbispora camponoti]
MRVLVAEDERDLADLVAMGLRRQAMAVDVVYDGAAAAERLAVSDYDVLVLDRDLPGLHGDLVCRELVARGSRTRILMMTAASSVPERVAGLGMGADDYLPKPFDFIELVARVRALGRRSRDQVPPVLTRHGIALDTHRLQASRDGRHLHLSLKEFAVLEVLMRAEGAVVSAERLLDEAWDENADPFTTVVRVVVSRLRAKLGDPPCIRTVPGAGYLL